MTPGYNPIMAKQLTFWPSPKSEHGGDTRVGLRKIARPICTKRPMHVVLKSSRATGDWSLKRKAEEVESLVRGAADRTGVRLYLYQNVGSHLHLATQAGTREGMHSFLRSAPARVAELVTGARKGKPVGRFWDGPAFSRVVQWGRDWHQLQKYFELNYWESQGLWREMVAMQWDPADAEIEPAPEVMDLWYPAMPEF